MWVNSALRWNLTRTLPSCCGLSTLPSVLPLARCQRRTRCNSCHIPTSWAVANFVGFLSKPTWRAQSGNTPRSGSCCEDTLLHWSTVRSTPTQILERPTGSKCSPRCNCSGATTPRSTDRAHGWERCHLHKNPSDRWAGKTCESPIAQAGTGRNAPGFSFLLRHRTNGVTRAPDTCHMILRLAPVKLHDNLYNAFVGVHFFIAV